ncbi:arginase [Xylariaceae sp. FL0255]|nr:arginase [Xylariaceae sp. FL0255]
MRPKTIPILQTALVVASGAKALQFPPGLAPAYNAAQKPLIGLSDDDIDVTIDSQFNGLVTYASVPYVNCLADEEVEGNKYDIAFLGAPFDTAVTGRPGARYGPGAIRSASVLGLRKDARDAWSVYTGKNPLMSWATVVDCGDVPVTWLDNNVALAQLTKAHKVVSSRKVANTTHLSVPRIITLGGDHTTTLPALRSTFRHFGPVSVIHFDSHLDTWDPAVLGGNISDYAGLNHGTFLHIAHEEGLIRNTSIHAGIRAPMVRAKGDLRNDVRCGFDRLTARDIDRFGGAAGIASRIRERVEGGPVYISVDIDVLDPAFAPATGTPEPGGWTTRELLSVLAALQGLDVIGADVVEVAPAYDTHGDTTGLAAAEVAFTLLELMVN